MAIVRAAIVTALFVFLAQPAGALAQFSSQSASSPAGAGTDYLHRYFGLVPGTAVQPGTANPAATGANNTLAIDLGRVPDTRTINDVVRVTNISSSARPLDLALVGTLTGIPGFEFSDGTTSKTIAAGVTWQLRVRTNAAAAGQWNGLTRFQEGADTFMRLDRPITSRQAPLAASALSAAPPTGAAQVTLNWTASTSTGVGGYNVYRATAAAGPYTKVNALPVAATTYTDTSVTLGGNYWYRVRAVAAGVAPDLESPDSNTIQAAVMPVPTSVSIPATVNNTLNWVSLATRANVTFQVVVPVGTAAGDTVSLSVTNGTTTINRSAVAAGGAQTINFTANNLTAWPDTALGNITMSTRITRGAFAGPLLTAGAGKDVILPGAPTGSQVIAGAQNPVNYVNSYTVAAAPVRVTSTAAATDTLQARLTSGAGTAIGSAAGPGTVNVPVNATALADTAVGGLAVAARVVDQAGNPSAWVNGTAATKDTVAPNNPNVTRINFQYLWLLGSRVSGTNGALSVGSQVRVFDYNNNTYYGQWTNANGTGGFGNVNVSGGNVPRTFGYESRDVAWNITPRMCGRYTANFSAGTVIACP